ncbi:MAG: helix-turn-helix transcriptional regulator [Proteobacteria bacterium]|nr:helix-turn-helix transcriptional regulator [Pseudomonadota bacterium]
MEEGLSQEELARKVDISRNYLSQIERGVATNLSWQVVERLITTLGIRSSEILEEQWIPSSLPPGLAEFALMADLPTGDVEMLAQVRYRGKQPTTPEEWRLLYNAVRIAMEGYDL